LALRAIGMAFCLALVACFAGLAVLYRLATPERLRGLIIGQLQGSFHRSVSIRRVSLVLHQGIRVDGLRVREHPSFPGEDFLSADALLIKYSPIGLLRGRLDLRSLRFIEPRIQVVRNRAGLWNVQDIFSGLAVSRGSGPAPDLFSADFIGIENGAARLLDQRGAFDESISSLSLEIENFSLETPFSFRVSLRESGSPAGRPIEAGFQAWGAASLGGLRLDEAYVALRKFEAQVQGVEASGSGSVRGFRAPRLSLRLRLPRLGSAELSRFHRVPGGLDVPAADWRLEASFPLRPPALKGVRRPRRILLRRLEADFPFGRLSARGRLEPETSMMRGTLSAQGVDLELAAAVRRLWFERAPCGILSGSASFSGPVSSPALSGFHLSVKSFALNLSKGQGLSKADLEVSGAKGLRSLDLSVRNGTYIGFGRLLSEVSLDARVRGKSLDVRRFEALWGETRFRLRACLRPMSDPRQIVVEAEADKVRIDRLYAGILEALRVPPDRAAPAAEARPWAQALKRAIPKRFPDLRGRVRVQQASSPNFETRNLDVFFDLKEIKRGLKDFGGRFRIAFGPGQVRDVLEVRASHRVLNVLLLPFARMHEINAKAVFSLETVSPKALSFNRIYGDFKARKGAVETRMLHCDGPQFVAFAGGRTDFAAETMDARVLMRLNSPRGQLPDRLVDTAGRPSMELRLGGNLNKPSVELTLRKMEASEIEGAVAAGMRSADPFDPAAGSCSGEEVP
jgi:hypothetical protein